MEKKEWKGLVASNEKLQKYLQAATAELKEFAPPPRPPPQPAATRTRSSTVPRPSHEVFGGCIPPFGEFEITFVPAQVKADFKKSQEEQGEPDPIQGSDPSEDEVVSEAEDASEEEGSTEGGAEGNSEQDSKFTHASVFVALCESGGTPFQYIGCTAYTR